MITLILLPVAAVHALWGFGIWFPVRDEERLAHAVVGARNTDRMPGPIPCFLVAGVLTMMAIVVWGSGTVVGFIAWGGAVVFLVRGTMAYMRLWRRMTPEQPFARLDQMYFGPLCFVLAVLFATRGFFG
ncbi:DUF3995 domain-containing protein [Yoonia sp. 2307UL14-13]|uniref:DUF3995 domain-containing protein n=1 Tax=Yoonia sp. 2307UL14-13 TaxID=3126506 RepID=UPI0030B3C1FF